jgi:hypothetical protein
MEFDPAKHCKCNISEDNGVATIGPHTPKWGTLSLADEYINNDSEFVTYDVACIDCGRSGSISFKLYPKEVMW